MMRYQRVSPDILSHSNGRKPSLKSFKDDTSTTVDHTSKLPTSYSFEGKSLRPRSASGPVNPSPTRDNQLPQFPFPSDPAAPTQTENSVSTRAADATSVIGYAAVAGDGLFQWGHRKRSRGSRTESRIASFSILTGAGEESSPQKRLGKIPRQSAIAAAEKVAAAAAAAAMPPPMSISGGFYTRGNHLRSSLPAQLTSRGVEDRSAGPTRSDKRSPSLPPEKSQKMSTDGVTDFSINPDFKQQPSDQETGEKLNLDHLEWPRIYISLSRKEKEDDFLAMRGTKLPQRPKKRAKNVDKTLQYCFPGMWLADLTRGRYEVREKKCVKKKRRGLKGMESMDSDSE